MAESPLVSYMKDSKTEGQSAPLLPADLMSVYQTATQNMERRSQAIADAKARLDADLAQRKNLELQKHDQDFVTKIPENIRAARYPGIDWDYNSGKNAIEFNYRLDSLDPRDPAYSARASVIEKQIPEDQRKQFIQTKQYSDAVNDWHAGREPYRIATALGDQMVQMKKYLDLGDKEGALDIAKGGLMKTVNSIQGKDALQLGEQMTKFGMIITGPEYGLQAGGGWLENIGRMLIAKGQSNSDKEKSDISGRIKDAFDLTFNADPDRFYKMSTGIYQAAKETANQHVTRIENMTSPFHAKAMGAVRLPDMSMIEAQQQNRMNPPAPGAVQNPSQMSGNPSPASAGPSAQQLQSIINGGSQFTPEQKAAAARLLNK